MLLTPARRRPRSRPSISRRTFSAQRERDPESALMHYRARSYDPRTGRFLQRDPLHSGRLADHFLYARNLPSSFTDPAGLQAEAAQAATLAKIRGQKQVSVVISIGRVPHTAGGGFGVKTADTKFAQDVKDSVFRMLLNAEAELLRSGFDLIDLKPDNPIRKKYEARHRELTDEKVTSATFDLNKYGLTVNATVVNSSKDFVEKGLTADVLVHIGHCETRDVLPFKDANLTLKDDLTVRNQLVVMATCEATAETAGFFKKKGALTIGASGKIPTFPDYARILVEELLTKKEDALSIVRALNNPIDKQKKLEAEARAQGTPGAPDRTLGSFTLLKE